MSEGAMSESAMLTSLRDIHLPHEAAGGVVADLSAVVALAGLVALLIVALLRAVSLRRPHRRARDVRARVAAMAAMPEATRRTALLHLLKEAQPERYAQLREGLYRGEGGVLTAELEAEVARLV